METTLKKRSHQWIDARSLAMCRLIAEKIRFDPDLFHKAIETLNHWKQIRQPTPRTVWEWEKIIQNNSVERVLEILTEESEEGNRLRQGDPFCGILTEEERLQILSDYEEIGA